MYGLRTPPAATPHRPTVLARHACAQRLSAFSLDALCVPRTAPAPSRSLCGFTALLSTAVRKA